LFGPTGEFLNYSFAERQRLVYLGVKRSRVPILVDASHSTFEGAVQIADEAIAAGADGLMLMPPYFFPYGQREIEEFYMQFANAVGDAVPLLIHNYPQATSAIELDVLRRLLETERFAGINDSSGDATFFERLSELRRERSFALMEGDDRSVGGALRAGADGVISGAACAVPELMTALAKSPAAEDLNARLLEFVTWTERFPFPVAIKRAVELRGQHSAPPLTPLAPESRAALDQFAQWFAAWLPTAKRAASNG
jgi:4-hydroxy-tetrahydrodipicolinate synthase